MPFLEERVRIILKTSKAQNTNGFPANLTQREVDVIKQLAMGKTDQEIADALFISTKTVSNHVGSILRKTKTGNRTEAARFSFNHRLLEAPSEGDVV